MRKPPGRRWPTVFTCVAVIAALAPAAARADQPANTAVATGAGLIATAGFASADGDVFIATFVVPAPGTSESPHGGAVSFTKPWASLEKWNGAPPAVGSTDPCSVVTNPTSWSGGHPVETTEHNAHGLRPLNGVYFDIACEDGAGVRTYRVRWDDMVTPWNGQPQPVGDTSQRPPEWYYWGSALQQPSGPHGALVVRADGAQNANVSICETGDKGTRCLTPSALSGSGGVVRPAASLISVLHG
ncbi:MAG: hypothetical protein QOI91_429 [Solirubrobacteraceae bacterium]|nr:hypothetical protein [Solirubrobacteraceae bacterium]